MMVFNHPGTHPACVVWFTTESVHSCRKQDKNGGSHQQNSGTWECGKPDRDMVGSVQGGAVALVKSLCHDGTSDDELADSSG